MRGSLLTYIGLFGHMCCSSVPKKRQLTRQHTATHMPRECKCVGLFCTREVFSRVFALQHTATRYSIHYMKNRHVFAQTRRCTCVGLFCASEVFSRKLALQPTATHCSKRNTLQHTVANCNALNRPRNMHSTNAHA